MSLILKNVNNVKTKLGKLDILREEQGRKDEGVQYEFYCFLDHC